VTLYGIVVAAGRGERFGVPKAEVLLRGVPLWRRAADAMRSAGVGDVVVVGPVPGGIPGGERRRDSVAAGLAALPGDAEWVLVHDAARPLATPGLCRAVLDRLLRDDVDGVVPALPVSDTLKAVVGDRVTTTVPRADLVAVQTPQGFRVATLRRAHLAGDEDATDDAALVERAGGSVVFVPGEPTNLKITLPGDLAVAEALLP
jgi:2-C-methyl-D-erythritol 4-phosphate cytidylyltransferase